MESLKPNDPPGALEKMGLENSKSSKKSQKVLSAPATENLIRGSSSDDKSFSKNKDYLHVAEVSQHRSKDEDSACSLSYSTKSSDQSPEAECPSEAKPVSRVKDVDYCRDSLISDDDSVGGEDGDVLRQLLELSIKEPPTATCPKDDRPTNSLVTDDESDLDDDGNRLVEFTSSGRVPQLLAGRGSISSEFSSDEYSDSGEDSLNDDQADESGISPVPAKADLVESVEDASKSSEAEQNVSQSPAKNLKPVPLKPPVQSFYIPRQNMIPETKDATVKSTAFERIKNGGKSKLFSNVLTDDTFWRVKSVQKAWNSINHLSSHSHWQQILNLGEPVLMNFKLIELKKSFEQIVQSTSDFAACSTVLEVLGEITRSKFEAHKAEVFKELATPQFIRNLYAIVDKCHTTRPKRAQLERFIENFVDVYGDVFLQLDSLATDGLSVDLEFLIENILSLLENEVDNSCVAQLDQLSNIIKSRSTLIRANSSFPYNVLDEESVESNIIDGPFNSVDHYLTIHYRLMKEDFQNSLKVGVINHIKAVRGMRGKSINLHLNVFRNVTLAPHLTPLTLKYKIIFHDNNVLARISDPASPYFLTGSLLMLTNTNFQEYSLVRVEETWPLEREKNYIFVSMVLGPPGLVREIHFDVMAEPSRLFEPYYRVLNAIRSIDGNHFPFLRYIVNVETVVEPPAYMKPGTQLRIDDYTCSLWEDDSWPPPVNIHLNPVQLDGLKKALRNELAIIQGPPGTGKTYLSKRIIEILLQNKTVWHQNGCDGAGFIVVVCFKNQSLDQLLTGLIKDGVKVLRVGTQSKEEMLDEYNLKTLKEPKYSQIYKKMRWILANEQKATMGDLQDSLEIMDEISTHSGIFRLEYFSHLLRLNDNNFTYLENNFEEWLLQIPCDEPDFRAVDKILGGQPDLDLDSHVYQITLTNIQNLLESVNSALNTELSWPQVDLLTSAAAFLVKKQTFLENWIYELKRPMSEVERLELFNFKKEFEEDTQCPLEELPIRQRWLLYKAWMHDLYEHHSKLVESLVGKTRANSQRHIEIEELLNMKKISQCDAEVIGMTTTAASKYFKMMDCLKPKIVLVEEAAEVMEAHTVASISKFCEHLILVGDHKQLRPLTSSHLIGKHAHLDYSLYERLVKNGFQPCTLETQYRMRPDIADLIRPAVYQNLYDAPSVLDYPQVLGVDCNVFFVDHNVREDVTPASVSRWNKHEAEFHLALCNYLVLQGYEPSRITILATYSEQEKYFNREKLNYPHLDEVLMATVDSFQGRENDIILLSLVRSNAEDVIGFLAQENRVNVALSRAKIGLFITGNKSNLLAKRGLWTDVIDVLQRKNAIGAQLPLKCQIHGKVSRVSKSSDIKTYKNGGCTRQCKVLLPCQHRCIHLCHPLDREHAVLYKCITLCDKLMDCSHRCTLTCHSTNPLVFKCFCKWCSPQTECEALLPCGHTCQKMSHDVDIEHQTTHQCQTSCNTKLTCGHICNSLCHLVDPEHKAMYKCPIKCEGLMACGHPCKVTASSHNCSKHKRCLERCGVPLPCSHPCSALCHHLDPNHEECHLCLELEKTPSGEYPACAGAQSESTGVLGEHENPSTQFASTGTPHKNHTVDEVCEQACQALIRLNCGHTQICFKQCHVESDPENHNIICFNVCNKVLSCGHKCTKNCRKHGQNYTHGPEVCCESCGHPCTNDYVHDCPSKDVVNCKNSHTEADEPTKSAYCVGSLQSEAVGGINVNLAGEDNDAVALNEEPEERAPPAECTNVVPHEGHIADGMCQKVCGAVLCYHLKKCTKLCHFASKPEKHIKCRRLCSAVLSCGHCCWEQCFAHDQSKPHGPHDKCKLCSLTDLVKQTLPSELSANVLCCHLIEESACVKKCHRRACGHVCNLQNNIRSHGCSSHLELKQEVCLKRCSVRLTCGHPCTKPCHIDDYVHDCSAKDCVNSFGLVDGLVPSELPKVKECTHKNHKTDGTCRQVCGVIVICPCGHERACTKNCHLESDPENHRSCNSQCDALLYCGHKCGWKCHVTAPHGTDDKCKICHLTDLVMQKCTSGSSTASPINLLCGHLDERSACKENCKGRPCGHPCNWIVSHKCSQHSISSKEMCHQQCLVKLSCNHRCSKQCHIDDYAHDCSSKDCVNSLGLVNGRVPSVLPMVEVRTHKNHKVDGTCTVICGTIVISACGHEQVCSKRCHIESGPDNHVSCYWKCEALLSCGHRCGLKCHVTVPHETNDRCAICQLTDLVMQTSSSSLSTVLPRNLLCAHLDERLVCQEKCKGRPCGHPCNRKVNHKCSEHPASSKEKCRNLCLVKLSCNHRCSKQCHIDDYAHDCSTNDCVNSLGLVNGRMPSEFPKVKISTHENHKLDGTCSEICGTNVTFSCGHALACRKICHLESDPANHGSCYWKCGVLLSCGHRCRSVCHVTAPHGTNDICKVCELTHLVMLNGSPGPATLSPNLRLCAHLDEWSACQERCKGRPCGHTCKLKGAHKCSEHPPESTKEVCYSRCLVQLSCGHLCSKRCHINDFDHFCSAAEGCPDFEPSTK